MVPTNDVTWSPPFEQAEYDRRLGELRRRMGERSINVLLLFIPENICYLTGYETIGFANHQTLFVPIEGPPVLFIRELELTVAQITTRLTEFEIFGDTVDPLERTREILKARGWLGSSIAAEFNGGFVSAATLLRLSEHIEGLSDGSGLVEQGRLIKSPSEIELIRRACTITEAGMDAALGLIQPGASENDVAAAAYGAMMSAGSDFFVVDPIVTSGWRSGVAHFTFANRTLIAGDTILLEFSGCHKRYFGPLMRAAAVAPVEQEVERMAATIIESLDAAIKAIVPGVTSGEVDEACRSVIEAAGYEPYFRKRTGYSVGLSFAPSWVEANSVSLQRDDPTVLVPGMVFHIPPALRMPRQYGLGFSETVLVTETGCDVLTNSARALHVGG